RCPGAGTPPRRGGRLDRPGLCRRRRPRHPGPPRGQPLPPGGRGSRRHPRQFAAGHPDRPSGGACRPGRCAPALGAGPRTPRGRLPHAAPRPARGDPRADHRQGPHPAVVPRRSRGRRHRGDRRGHRHRITMANSPSGDSMLDRLVRILDAFDADHPALTVTALARRAAVPRATAYRLVEDLVSHGLLARNDDGETRLGMRLWELSNRAALTRDLRLVALPYMEDINRLLQQNTQLSVLHEDEVLIVERLSRPGAAVNQAHVAGRMPVLRTSMGMALLAFAPQHVAEAFIDRHQQEALALHPDLRRVLAHIRLTGYAT